MELFARFTSGLDCFHEGDTVNAVTGVSVAGSTFTVVADLSALEAGDKIGIVSSTRNDGAYTVVTATYDTDHTDIVVSETILDATVDGGLFVGHTSTITDTVTIPALLACEWTEWPVCSLLTIEGTGELGIITESVVPTIHIVVSGLLYVDDPDWVAGNTVEIKSGGQLNGSGNVTISEQSVSPFTYATGQIIGDLTIGDNSAEAAYLFADECTITVGGDLRTGSCFGFADGGSVTVTGEIVCGDIEEHFNLDSTIYANKVTCNSIGDSFIATRVTFGLVYVTATVTVGNIGFEFLGAGCSLAADVNGTPMGDLVVGDVASVFAQDEAVFHTTKINCGVIEYSFCNTVGSCSATDIVIAHCGDFVFNEIGEDFTATSLRVNSLAEGKQLMNSSLSVLLIPHIVVGTKFTKPLDVLNTGLL